METPDFGSAERRDSRTEACGFYGQDRAEVKALTTEYPGIGTPKDLYLALRNVWSRDTCAPRLRDKWSPDDPTVGQCSITAFLAQDIFGGKVYGIPLPDGNFHCYNVVGERTFDLTSEQFLPQKLTYADDPEQSRETHFAKKEKRLRYEALREKLLETL